MKKIIIALALLAGVQIAGAQQQVKSLSAAKSAVESAVAATQNAKKAANPATWLKLGQAYIDAFNAPQGNGWIGASENELNLLMSRDRVLGVREETVQGRPYTVKSYESSDYYFDQNGILSMIKVTKPVVENSLGLALDAYKQAYAVDAKAKKTADIANGIKDVAEKLSNEAVNAYTFGDLEKASELFEAAADASVLAPFAQLDTNSLYNAGLTAWMLASKKEGEEAAPWYQRAQKIFDKSLEMNYMGENGEVFAKLSDIADKLGDKALSKEYLQKGFAAFPGSQSIIVGLINYYVNAGEDPNEIFKLLDLAKANEPNNASLYYVEGNIRKDLGDEAAALAAYDKCAEINPNYEYGYVGRGILLYNKAVDLQEKGSNEMDDAKYQAIMQEFEAALKGCIEPFEKAFEITKVDDVKTSIAQFLKNACFRFRTDPEYQAKYDKYNAVANGQ
ncbi:MAG: hypothetical protein IK030_03325 [Bacteroidales bacterium]|nr:hypothetical protein [Bacteroidales bacterium]